ncbi:hypothetical protein [Microbacterium trichothecenolyticum]|uniref:Dolichyl-phosphate-mannose-protein mannosyltransferase n=1 Tax=Microbacterium trichothecenolyticum TaxID=69370 RepID=A0ABU0TUJ4_MICTR|nr:hypothetical protein [Microbacterium trichothecenolyticum]MDQ1123340.1 hypothetical protein [Microbacterium trichothecenolyticum]
MNLLRPRAAALSTGAALLVALVATIPQVVSGHISRDSGVFLYTGMVVSRGGMPYVDSWDHKGPLLAAIETVAWRMGGGIAGAPLLEGLSLFLGLAVAGLIWTRWIGRGAAPVMLLTGVTYLAVFEGGNFTETWLFPVQLVAYSLAGHVAMRSGREASTRAVASLALALGAALAVGLFTRVNNVVGVMLVVAGGLVYLRRRALFGAVVFTVVGVVGLGLGLWLWSGDALRAGIDQYVTYNLFYSGGASTGDRVAAFATLAQLLVSGAVVAAALASTAAWLVVRRGTGAVSSRVVVVVVLFTVVGAADALSQMVSGRPYPHYLVVAIAAFAVVIVAVGPRLLSGWPRSSRVSGRVARTGMSVAAAVLVVLVVSPSASTAAQGLRTVTGTGVFVPGSYQAQLVDRVLAETSPDDRVLVHGAETWILAASHRLSATPITYSLPVEQGYGGLARKYLADVTAFPPALIVESPTSCGISTECPPGAAHFSGLAPFVASSYELEGDIVGFRFWRRVPDAVSPSS